MANTFRHCWFRREQWLAYKLRFNIKKMRESGEYGDVSGDMIRSWIQLLPELLGQKMFSTSTKMAAFGGPYLRVDLGKTRIFLVSATETLVVSKSPRCFCGFHVRFMPSTYYCQSKSWMTGEILVDYLTTFTI